MYMFCLLMRKFAGGKVLKVAEVTVVDRENQGLAPRTVDL